MLLGQDGAPAKTLGERFGVDAKRRADADGRNNAGVNISIYTCPAEAEKPSDL